MRTVGGQEDMIEDVALNLSRAVAEASAGAAALPVRSAQGAA
jgi:hypothetical protein